MTPDANNLHPNPPPLKLDPDPSNRLDLTQDIWIFYFNKSPWIQSATPNHIESTVMMTLKNYHKFIQEQMFKAPNTESSRPTLQTFRTMIPPLTPPPKQDNLEISQHGIPEHLTKRGAGDTNPNSTSTADIMTITTPVRENKSGKKARINSAVPMETETPEAAKKMSGTSTTASQFNARCRCAATHTF